MPIQASPFTRGLKPAIIAELLAKGASAHKHPSGSFVILTLPSGPPSLMLSCDVMDHLVDQDLVVAGADGVYRPRRRR